MPHEFFAGLSAPIHMQEVFLSEKLGHGIHLQPRIITAEELQQLLSSETGHPIMEPRKKQLVLDSMKNVFLEGSIERLLLGLQFFQVHFLIRKTILEDLVG